jgi:DNA-binding ferritin-like protein (Dps family)
MNKLNNEWVELFEGKEKEQEIARIIGPKVLEFIVKLMRQSRVSGVSPKNVLKYIRARSYRTDQG